MKGRHTGKKPTIKDIAREANVSPATVSLVLRDRETPRVSPATRNQVLKIAKRLNYKPNIFARSLVGKESLNLGLVITSLQNPFYAEITHEIIDQAMKKNYGVIATSVAKGDLDAEQRVVHNLLDRGVDGLVICSTRRHDPLIYELKAEGVRFVLAWRTVEQKPTDPSVDFFGLDNQRGAVMVIDHLVKLGHKRIALISGPRDTSTGYDRYMGAMSAFEAHGIDADRDLILFGDFYRESGYELTQKLLRSKNRPTAIFAGNDCMAMGVLDALAEQGLKVPFDMALVGFDDIEMAGLPGIDLTTVAHLKNTIGRLAVDHLIDKIRGESDRMVKKIILDPLLVIRKSCGYRSESDEDKGTLDQGALQTLRRGRPGKGKGV
jgi:DNA-binding LacI/PurR family transcriptional regulator